MFSILFFPIKFFAKHTCFLKKSFIRFSLFLFFSITFRLHGFIFNDSQVCLSLRFCTDFTNVKLDMKIYVEECCFVHNQCTTHIYMRSSYLSNKTRTRNIHYISKKSMKVIRERRQLGFVTLNGNLAVNLKPTHLPLLNGKGQFTFWKTKSSRSSGIVVYAPKFEFLKN